MLIIGVLLQCGNLKMLPRQSCYKSALEWLRQRTGDGEDDNLMRHAMLLHDYFPDGPTLVDKRMIDVVVVTGSSMYIVLYPILYPTDFSLVLDSLNYTVLSSSDSPNRFCEEITFSVPRGDGETDWQGVVHLNDYLDRSPSPQFVENVVQRPRQAAGNGNSGVSAKMVVSCLKSYLLNC